MATRILIPTPLRPYTDKKDAVEAEGATVGELLADLTKKHVLLKAHLYNEQGKLRNFVNVYLNDEDIRYMQKEQTPVSPGDTISIIPSVAGGAPTSAPDVGSVPLQLQLDRDLPQLNNDEIKRYSRHLIMPEVGLDGQRKLKAGRVLCVGAGGLGSPAAMYLAAAGVGAIGLVDFDLVDFSNLQRQIIHGTPDVGRSKLASAPTRYLTNDACVLLGKPNAYGSIFRFEGQASVFATRNGPCYRCLYPEPPPPGLVPSCAEGGVLGVLPGIIGVIQATEALKLIAGIGEPLIGRFLLYDALKMRFRELKVPKDPECPVCGLHPTITKLIDYEQFCGIHPVAPESTTVNAQGDITSVELKQRLDRGDKLTLVDVREPNEFQINRIPGTVLIPLGEIPRRYAELNKDDEIVVHCKMGGRSAKAADFLRSVGFRRVLNLKGGILDWIDRVDPTQPKY